MTRSAPEYLEPAFTPAQRRGYGMAVALWAALVLWFAFWWFQTGHNIGTGRFVLVSSGLVWLYFLQAWFLYFFLRACRPRSRSNVVGPYRVAMIVTKTPSEQFMLLQVTLRAMLAQDLAHDTWLADEDPDPEVISWCRAHGVRISCRKDMAGYHRQNWPRRKCCKEGNLSYFYDHYGYESYDLVVQLDADHVPQPGYLRAMLAPFADPGVGYVSAPSICAQNEDKSWAARTRLDAEALFHGGLQAGYSNGWAPMCIGSHYALRTRALRDVGGLGPELAEDHSTTMILNAGGWHGVHASDAIAIGAGPATFADMVTQEFQWSRSLMTLLLRYTRRYLGALPARLKFQFVFCQLWYPLFALFMALMFVMPVLAVLFDMRFVGVTYPQFLTHAVPPVLVLLLIVARMRADGFFRPAGARVISWERTLFTLAQWPWVLWGCAVAIWDRLTGRFVAFRITPKGGAVEPHLPWRVLMPYGVLAAVSLLPVVFAGDVREAAGFYLLALVNACFYTALFIAILALHRRENHIALRLRPWSYGSQAAVALLLLALGATGFNLRTVQSVHALTQGLGPLALTREVYPVSGAGQAPPGSVYYQFDLRWN
jgi:cellulose synthase/poly-beta-1,6-N-acetylglucosamine synthase-like glycosyltransferase